MNTVKRVTIPGEMLHDARAVLTRSPRTVRELRRAFGYLTLCFIALALLSIPFDGPLDAMIKARGAGPWRELAGHLRHWGRVYDSLCFTALLFVAGLLRRRRAWRTLAMACVVAVAVDGIAVNVVRVLTGRPRPRAEQPGRWVGPTVIYRLQGFPSGHASASFACATVLLVGGAPALGVPALVSASGVAWSSLCTRNHYMSDVVAGIGIGALLGTAMALTARRINRERDEEEPAATPTYREPCSSPGCGVRGNR